MPRPLDVGAVMRRVFGLYVDQAPVLMPAAAVLAALVYIFATVLAAEQPSLTIVVLTIDFVAIMVFTGMTVELVAAVRGGRRDASALQLLRAITPVLGQLAFVGFVALVATLVGLSLFIVPGLMLLTIWAVCAPVVVIERPPGLSALQRSAELVRGNGWGVFVVVFVLVIMVIFASVAIEIEAEAGGLGLAIGVRAVLGVLTAPLMSLSLAVLYFELREANGTPPVGDDRETQVPG